jgi:hypothetical protein
MQTEKKLQLLKIRYNELRKDRNKYKKAYQILECYFDSIADDEQEIVAKKLKTIFK